MLGDWKLATACGTLDWKGSMPAGQRMCLFAVKTSSGADLSSVIKLCKCKYLALPAPRCPQLAACHKMLTSGYYI